jgi:GTP-binding protein
MSPVARFLAAAAEPEQLPRFDHPEIAFAGRSNVGKSSLLNRLVGQRRLARVSKTPGRTQQLNFFLVDEQLVFVDLPGYGFARVPARIQQHWKRLVETYLTGRANLRAVVVIADVRRGVSTDDAQVIEFVRAHRIPAILVLTKADKLGYGERQRRLRAIQHERAGDVTSVVLCSAVSGEGIAQVWRTIDSCCRVGARPMRPPPRGE